MTPKGAALNVDAQVTLDELLDRNARETLVAGAADLGVELTVVDRDGRIIAASSELRAQRMLGKTVPPDWFGSSTRGTATRDGTQLANQDKKRQRPDRTSGMLTPASGTASAAHPAACVHRPHGRASPRSKR